MGYFDVLEGFTPDRDALNETLEKGRMGRVSVTSVELVELPPVGATYELTVRGLG